MERLGGSSDTELYAAFEADRATRGARDRRLLRLIREFDKRGLWEHDGCRHMGQWLALEYGITVSEGLRRTHAAHVIESLPVLAAALEDGSLSLDKVVQLARFATADTEGELVAYARKRSLNAVRDRADVAARKPPDEARDAHEWRYLRWWPCDHTGSIGLDGRLPAAQGAAVTKALEEIAGRLVPGEEEGITREQRQADALVKLAKGAAGETSRKPLLVIHTSTEALLDDAGGSEIEGAGAVHPEVVRRIACDARLQMVLHDPTGATVGIGHTARNIPDWLRREVIRRDRGCAFCGTMRFVECHHVVPWPDGPTDLRNLVLLCGFHHDLVHEGGWRVALDERGLPLWFRPDGSRYERARPARGGSDDGTGGHGAPDDAAPPRARPARLALVAAGFG